MDFQRLIIEICEEENIKYDLISAGWCFALSKNNKTKYIIGKSFSLNNQAISKIIDDKYALYELCILKNIPIIKHHLLHNPLSSYGKDTLKNAHKYFLEYNSNIVIKPNNGCEGSGVYHITNIFDLDKYLNELFKDNFSISLCPYYNIDKEFRIVVLDNEVKLIYEKIRPTVFGNGKKTIKELLNELNPYYFQDRLDNNYNRVLKDGEKYLYDWRFNLSKGATAKVVDDEIIKGKLSKLAIDITKKIGASFVTVDIVLINNELYLLEINSSVCINKVCHFIDNDYKLAKSIYKEAILKMFEEN